MTTDTINLLVSADPLTPQISRLEAEMVTLQRKMNLLTERPQALSTAVADGEPAIRYIEGKSPSTPKDAQKEMQGLLNRLVSLSHMKEMIGLKRYRELALHVTADYLHLEEQERDSFKLDGVQMGQELDLLKMSFLHTCDRVLDSPSPPSERQAEMNRLRKEYKISRTRLLESAHAYLEDCARHRIFQHYGAIWLRYLEGDFS